MELLKSNLDKSLIDDVKYFYGMDESKKKFFILKKFYIRTLSHLLKIVD